MLHEEFVDRLARLQVGANGIVFHWTRVERLGVEHVQLFWKQMIVEVPVEYVSSRYPRPKAAIAPVVGKPLVVSDDAARLVALVVAAEGRPLPTRRRDRQM